MPVLGCLTASVLERQAVQRGEEGLQEEEEVTAWDRCAEKGHRWGPWVNKEQNGEKWQERICEICHDRETAPLR